MSTSKEVEWLQPLVSSAALRPEEREEIIDAGMRERFRVKLRERWTCIEHGHCLYYRVPEDDQHIPLSAEEVEVY
ncbi:hypothetical protein BU17DRAFT_82013 [Hysterangium stoloniferum]|nr:hypothetical protein BU17DRAFT_82013 [Hysterangium stoloniferum]